MNGWIERQTNILNFPEGNLTSCGVQLIQFYSEFSQTLAYINLNLMLERVRINIFTPNHFAGHDITLSDADYQLIPQ